MLPLLASDFAIPHLLATLALLASLGLGLLGALAPDRARRLVGLAYDPARVEGVSEIRATYGGVFTGFSLAALLIPDPAATLAAGAGWAGAFALRAASTALDRVPLGPNLPGLLVEGLIAAGCFAVLLRG